MVKAKKLDPVVEDYLKNGLHQTRSQYLDNAVWSAFRDAIENKLSSGLRKQVQEAAEPKLVADAYAWKYQDNKQNKKVFETIDKHLNKTTL